MPVSFCLSGPAELETLGERELSSSLFHVLLVEYFAKCQVRGQAWRLEKDLDGITDLVTLRAFTPGQRSYYGRDAASFGLCTEFQG